MHCLAARIYKRDWQTSKEAITEREKLNAAQQLTTTILPSSMVNMVSKEDDQCFQCQEPGHITWHCPHIRCHECKEYRHIVMDCTNKISPSGTPAQHHKAQHTETATPGQALDTAKKIEKEKMVQIIFSIQQTSQLQPSWLAQRPLRITAPGQTQPS